MSSASASEGLQVPNMLTIVKPKRKRRAKDDERPIKRRTKEGCLTCRKRRIKCDELRPGCRNCHKSKRDCEYAQIDGLQLPQGSRAEFTRSSPSDRRESSYARTNESEGPIAFDANGRSIEASNTFHQATPLAPQAQLGNRHVPYFSGTGLHESLPPQAFGRTTNWAMINGACGRPTLPGAAERNGYGTLNHPRHGSLPSSSRGIQHNPPCHTNRADSAATSYPDAYRMSYASLDHNNDNIASARSSHNSSYYEGGSINGGCGQPQDNTLHFPMLSSGQAGLASQAAAPGAACANEMARYEPLSYKDTRHGTSFTDTSQFLDSAAVPNQDDDYWDVNSDDEVHNSEQRCMLTVGSLEADMERVLAISTRNVSSYVRPGFSISHYIPSEAASPLRNENTQKVFAHFVSTTAPMMSFCAQRDRLTLPGEAAQTGSTYICRGLWTHVLAMMAMRDQGLLHAVLAMSSYHIARTHGAATTPAHKHYTYAIRNIHRSVRPGKRRHEVTTLAATILLAFYEVMTADHRAWNTHLAGAIQLIREVNFVGMTAHIKYCRYQGLLRIRSGIATTRDHLINHIFPQADLNLINNIMGREAFQDKFGHPIEDWPAVYRQTDLTDADIHKYSTLQDLFWYSCRHDVIHALVGANPLMLDYKDWGICLPRGPVGQADSANGTYDHVLLLYGRLVQFMSKDRPRKIRVNDMKAKSRPTPPLAESNHRRPLKPAGPVPGPGSYGMAPSAGMPRIPRAFQLEQPFDQPSPPTREEIDIELDTNQALFEWHNIMAAFETFAHALGPAYQPLAADDPVRPCSPTPFGPSLHYRSQTIAIIMVWLYTGLIIAHRSHPAMPPAIAHATGLAARTTAPYAQKVGQILYSVSLDLSRRPIDADAAGAFTDELIPLLFAGVQFMSHDQRLWAVMRLKDIERATGWTTINLIANGCESAWQKAHEAGQGSPWTKCYGVSMNADGSAGIQDVTPSIDPGMDTDLPTGQCNAEMREAQLRQSQKGKDFVSYTAKSGQQMWAKPLYGTY